MNTSRLRRRGRRRLERRGGPDEGPPRPLKCRPPRALRSSVLPRSTRRSTTMADDRRMTAPGAGGQADERRARRPAARGVAWLLRELMEAEVAAQIGAEHGERAPERIDAPQRLPPARLGHPGGRARAGDPQAALGHATSRASWSRAPRASRRWSRSSRRPTSTASRPARSTAWSQQLGLAGHEPEHRSRACAAASTSRCGPSASARWRAATRTCGSTPRWSACASRGGGAPQVPGGRLRRCTSRAGAR